MDLPLEGILVHCAHCNYNFAICKPCWRGQVYCTEECRRAARRIKQQQYQKKYRQTKKGRLKQSQNQKKFRQNLKNEALASDIKKIVSEHPSKVEEKAVIGWYVINECFSCGVKNLRITATIGGQKDEKSSPIFNSGP